MSKDTHTHSLPDSVAFHRFSWLLIIFEQAWEWFLCWFRPFFESAAGPDVSFAPDNTHRNNKPRCPWEQLRRSASLLGTSRLTQRSTPTQTTRRTTFSVQWDGAKTFSTRTVFYDMFNLNAPLPPSLPPATAWTYRHAENPVWMFPVFTLQRGSAAISVSCCETMILAFRQRQGTELLFFFWRRGFPFPTFPTFSWKRRRNNAALCCFIFTQATV